MRLSSGGNPHGLTRRLLRRIRHAAANRATIHAVRGEMVRAEMYSLVASWVDARMSSPYAMTQEEWRRTLRAYRRAAR